SSVSSAAGSSAVACGKCGCSSSGASYGAASVGQTEASSCCGSCSHETSLSRSNASACGCSKDCCGSATNVGAGVVSSPPWPAKASPMSSRSSALPNSSSNATSGSASCASKCGCPSFTLAE